MRYVLLAILAATLVSCQREMAPHTRSAEEQVIRDRLGQWTRFMNNESLDSLDSYYAQVPEFTAAWPDGSRQRGWAEQEDALRTMFGNVTTLNVVVQDPEVHVVDFTTAIVTFRFGMDQILRGRTRDVFAGQATQVWARDGAGADWRILAEQYSRNPAGDMARPLRP